MGYFSVSARDGLDGIIGQPSQNAKIPARRGLMPMRQQSVRYVMRMAHDPKLGMIAEGMETISQATDHD